MIRTAAIVSLVALSGTAHAVLSRPGDIAFTAFNADEDGFAIVALTPIGPGSTVYFTDNEWPGGAPGNAAFNTGESSFRWVTGNTPIPAGTVVRFSAIDQPSRAASLGTFSVLEGTSLGLSATGDTLYAYTGITQLSPLVFLAAISSEGFAGNDLTGTGLVEGSSAIAIASGADFGEYLGPRAGQASFAAYASLVSDVTRWSGFPTGSFAATAPNVTSFTIGATAAALPAVPEPATCAMLLAGLGIVGLRLRRWREPGLPLDCRLTRPMRVLPAFPSAP